MLMLKTFQHKHIQIAKKQIIKHIQIAKKQIMTVTIDMIIHQKEMIFVRQNLIRV